MEFKFKDETLFLNFVPAEGRWFLYQPTPFGIRRSPVYDDAANYGIPVLIPTTPEEHSKIIN